MRRRFVFLVVLSLMFVSAIFAQQKTNKFLVRVNGEQIGTEEYSVTRTADTYKLKSKARMKDANLITQYEQDQVLATDFSLKRYTLAAATMSGIETIEASREKESIRMRVRVPNSEPKTFSVPMAPRIVVLDNMVVSHFQVLLDSLAGAAPTTSYGFLVPRQLSLEPGGVTIMPRTEKATLSGSALTVRKYSVNCGGLIMEMWADATDSRLMRVWVPTQKVEFIREGFTLGANAQAQATSGAAH